MVKTLPNPCFWSRDKVNRLGPVLTVIGYEDEDQKITKKKKKMKLKKIKHETGEQESLRFGG